MKKYLLLTSLICFTLTRATAQPIVKPGIWRAVLALKAGELPFGLDIQPNATKTGYTVYALNGAERLKMDEATLKNDSLHIPMSIFDSELVGHVSGNKLTGFWRKRRTKNELQVVPFSAQHGLAYRFVPSNAKPATTNLTGKWATLFRAVEGGDTTLAVGVFTQKGTSLTGTFLTPTGDYRYLAGDVVGDSLLLSCFDGNHAFLFKAKQQTDKTLRGLFQSGAVYQETWTARLDPNVALPDPAKLTYVKPGQTFGFAFPDPVGNVISNNDERFKNKVTVVQLLGTWCPNCMDETKFLGSWLKKNRSRGVEVVGLAFEKVPTLAASGPKIQRMAQRFAIDYPVLLAGSNNKDEASAALPSLNRVVAFPTTIFLDKTGRVRHIHTGFAGPGTGVYYDRYIDEFNRLLDKLLAE